MVALFKPNVEKLWTKGDVEGLIKALGYEKNPHVREHAASALGKIGDERAVEPLIKRLADGDRGVQWSAKSALGNMGNSTVEPLIEALKDENEGVRRGATSALGKIGDERAVEPLIEALKDENEEVRGGAALALGKFGDERAVEPLIEALKDENKDVRNSATLVLGEIGDESVVEPLIEALKDENEKVRGGAASALGNASALGKIDDERAVELLIEALKDESEGYSSDVIEALSKIGGEEAESAIKRYEEKKHKKEEPFMIGSSKVLLYLNANTVRLLKEEGLEETEYIVGVFMAREFGTRDELVQVSTDTIQLSRISKARCITTPIYKDMDGGIYVLFEEIDENTRSKEGLEYLGTINPRLYAASVCEKFNISNKEILV